MEYQCTECGKVDSWRHFRDDCEEAIKMKATGTCFSCAFWLCRLDEQWGFLTNPSSYSRIVIADGNHYIIGDENAIHWRGHGGVRFVIEFLDGRTVTTTNLWAQGPIPPHFRQRLPDNARFVK